MQPLSQLEVMSKSTDYGELRRKTVAPSFSMKRIDDIEFLRAIAILFTLVAHLPVLIGGSEKWNLITSVFTFGAGVDLFFVISGFVITRSLLAQDRHSFGQLALPFWIRRAWRILPAAWLWLALPLLATAYFNKSGAFGKFDANLSDAFAAFFQYANIHQHNCYNVIPKTAVCAEGGFPFGVYWSLSLEEQFYLLFPFLIYFTPRKYLPWVVALIVLSQLFIPRVHTLLWSIRTDGLMIGVLIALLGKTVTMMRPGLVFAALCLGLAVTPSLHIPFTTGLLALFSGILVFFASQDKGYTSFRLFKPTIWIGSRSYALYLLHLPIYCLTQELWYRMKPAVFGWRFEPLFAITAIALLYVFAELTYRMVENPLRKIGQKKADETALRLTSRRPHGMAS